MLGQNIGRVGLPDMSAGGRPSLTLDFVSIPVLNEKITFTRASTARYFNSSGVLTSAAVNEARFDYNPSTLAARGLLIEEQRTNSIRNNAMQGGGSGVAPTNWTANGSTGNGITLTVVGVGIENGIAYVDYEINGTATITGTAISIVFDTTTGIAASAAQVWVWSSYLKLAAGALTDLTFTPRISWRDSGGGAVGSNDGTSVPTNTGLATQRPSFSATAPASTGYVQPQLRIGTVNGSTYTGVQIRIGLPQLELGAFATSVIPTSGTALTRNADVASVNTLSPWYRADEGTLFAEAQSLRPVSDTTRIVAISDNTANNSIRLNAASITNAVVTLGANEATFTLSYTVGAVNKWAIAYASNNANGAVNGVTGTTDTSVAIPVVNILELGRLANGASGSPLVGYIRRITYYPRRLSNAELVSITS